MCFASIYVNPGFLKFTKKNILHIPHFIIKLYISFTTSKIVSGQTREMERATNLSRYLNLAKKNQEGNFIVKMKIHKLLQHLNFEMIM